MKQALRFLTIFLLTAGVILFYPADVHSAGDVPLPADIEISSAESLSDDQAAFLGMWGNGKWDNRLAHVLVVTHVDQEGNVRGIYAWGRYRRWGVTPGYTWFNGKIADGVLTATLPNAAEVSYRVSGTELKGEYNATWLHKPSRVTLQRIEGG